MDIEKESRESMLSVCFDDDDDDDNSPNICLSVSLNISGMDK